MPPGTDSSTSVPAPARLRTRNRPPMRSARSRIVVRPEHSGRLEARDGRDQAATGDPVGGRERLARVVVGPLLGDRGRSERAADDDPPERAGTAPELALDELAVVHASMVIA